MEEEHKLKRSDHSQAILSRSFEFLQNNELTDCVLSADGETIKAHRFILAAASPYFEKIFSSSICSSPTLIFTDLKYGDILNFLEYAYNGELTIGQTGLINFIKIAKKFEIKNIEKYTIDIIATKDEGKHVKENESVEQLKYNETVDPDSERQSNLSDSTDTESSYEESWSARISRMRNASRVITTRYIATAAVSTSTVTDCHPKRRRPKANRNRSGMPDKPKKCRYCRRSYSLRSTLTNHERFCSSNPNRTISRCPFCFQEVRPGSMTFHKKTYHNYVPKPVGSWQYK